MRNWSKGKKCACATEELSERDRFRYEVLYKGMTIRQVIEQNPIAYQNDSGNLMFRVKYITETAPMPLMRINYYISMQKMKSWFRELGKVCFRRHWLGLCILI